MSDSDTLQFLVYNLLPVFNQPSTDDESPSIAIQKVGDITITTYFGIHELAASNLLITLVALGTEIDSCQGIRRSSRHKIIMRASCCVAFIHGLLCLASLSMTPSMLTAAWSGSTSNIGSLVYLIYLNIFAIRITHTVGEIFMSVAIAIRVRLDQQVVSISRLFVACSALMLPAMCYDLATAIHFGGLRGDMPRLVPWYMSMIQVMTTSVPMFTTFSIIYYICFSKQKAIGMNDVEDDESVRTPLGADIHGSEDRQPRATQPFNPPQQPVLDEWAPQQASRAATPSPQELSPQLRCYELPSVQGIPMTLNPRIDQGPVRRPLPCLVTGWYDSDEVP
ncbi:hypothetical protein DCS_01396 [Drechmeria coniospora]|uniref:Uncharacterized protein n=1 Tax=Drechmeria coniospora TaxID=98403 RepID=A0A151GT15_DRECN|nr:hypothetical protein DCS_01396 [Drechmeria coniospora]KYK60259.1 hypothetical protein DCS_01396 [Drechmeria coniospora]